MFIGFQRSKTQRIPPPVQIGDVANVGSAPALTLAATPHAAPRHAWEELSADLWGAPFSVTLDTAQVEEPDRPFTLMPLPGRALPEGLLPLTPYRLRGLEVPAGAEGVNVLHEALWVRGGGAASLAPLGLVGEGGEREVQRTQLFA